MWHNISQVCKDHFLSPSKLNEFCLKNENMVKFGIVCDQNLEIHTWYVDDLIKAFREETQTSEQLAENHQQRVDQFIMDSIDLDDWSR